MCRQGSEQSLSTQPHPRAAGGRQGAKMEVTRLGTCYDLWSQSSGGQGVASLLTSDSSVGPGKAISSPKASLLLSLSLAQCQYLTAWGLQFYPPARSPPIQTAGEGQVCRPRGAMLSLLMDLRSALRHRAAQGRLGMEAGELQAPSLGW